MRINIPLDKKTALIIVAASAAIILFPIGYSVVSVAFPGPHPFLNVDEPGKTHHGCIDGIERRYMRFHHMDLLREIRDEVVRQGRTSDIGLDSCWACHTSRAEFCNRCHNAVNLQLGCFRCHYDPESAESAPTARSGVSEG